MVHRKQAASQLQAVNVASERQAPPPQKKGRPSIATSLFPKEPPKSALLCETSQYKNVASSIETLLAKQNKSAGPA